MVASENEADMKNNVTPASRLTEAREELGLNKKKAADQLGVGYSTYRGWEQGRAEPEVGFDAVIRHLKAGDTLSSRQRQGNAKGDPIYDTPASAGDGITEFTEQPVGHMPPSQSLSSAGREVYWMPVQGDSMGQKYQKHTLVPVAKFDQPATDISADDVYVIRLEGAIQIKRLQRLSGQRVRVISDNESYPNEVVQLDEGVDFQILGRVLV